MEGGVLWLNYNAFVVFVNGLPGTLAQTLKMRSSLFGAFADIGSHYAKTFSKVKLKRAASDQAATHLRSETDGPSLKIVSNPGEERNNRPPKSTPLDLNAFIRTCLEDDDVDPQVAERRLAKVALVRQFQESSSQQLALAKRQKLADIEKYKAETRATQEANIEETRARKEANIEKLHAERDQTQVERARIQAERQEVRKAQGQPKRSASGNVAMPPSWQLRRAARRSAQRQPGASFHRRPPMTCSVRTARRSSCASRSGSAHIASAKRLPVVLRYLGKCSTWRWRLNGT